MDMNLNKKIKMTNNDIVEAYLEDRSIRVYRHGVDGRLRHIGLSNTVKRATGQEPKVDEAYIFYVKNQDVVKILMKGLVTINVVEFHGCWAQNVKDYLEELGLT